MIDWLMMMIHLCTPNYGSGGTKYFHSPILFSPLSNLRNRALVWQCRPDYKKWSNATHFDVESYRALAFDWGRAWCLKRSLYSEWSAFGAPYSLANATALYIAIEFLSICPSVARRYCGQTNQAEIEWSSPPRDPLYIYFADSWSPICFN